MLLAERPCEAVACARLDLVPGVARACVGGQLVGDLEPQLREQGEAAVGIMRRAVIHRRAVKVDEAELLREIDVGAGGLVLAVEGTRNPIEAAHVAQHLKLVGQEGFIRFGTSVIDDEPSLWANQLAGALGIDELIIIDVAIAENVADSDVAQFQAGGICDAPDAAIGCDFQAATVVHQFVRDLVRTVGLLLREQAGKICFIDGRIGGREAEAADQYTRQHTGIIAIGNLSSGLFSRPEIVEDQRVSQILGRLEQQ